MMLRQRLLERRLSRCFGREVHVWRGPAQATGPSRQGMLRRVRRMAGLLPAQKAIRSSMSDLSVTHAGSHLYVLAAMGNDPQGVGIDFEPWRPLDARHARLILTPRERQHMSQASSDDLLRIWTVKEALFKADLGGQRQWVNAYALDTPGRNNGFGKIHNKGRCKRFRYTSIRTPEGILSTAFALGVGRNARQ